MLTEFFSTQSRWPLPSPCSLQCSTASLAQCVLFKCILWIVWEFHTRIICFHHCHPPCPHTCPYFSVAVWFLNNPLSSVCPAPVTPGCGAACWCVVSSPVLHPYWWPFLMKEPSVSTASQLDAEACELLTLPCLSMELASPGAGLVEATAAAVRSCV